MFIGPGLSAWRTAPPDAAFDYSSVTGYTVDISADFVTTSGGLVTGFVDQALAHDFSQATSTNQPTYEATGWGDGTPSALFDGVDNYVSCATSLATDLVGGTDNSFTLYIVAQLITGNVAGDGIVAFGSSSSDTPFVRWAISSGSDQAALSKRDDANLALVTSASSTLGTTARIITIANSGTAYTIRVDGSTTTSGAMDTGAVTLNRAAIGAFVRTTVGSFTTLRFKRMIGYTAEHNSTEYGNVEAALLAEHF